MHVLAVININESQAVSERVTPNAYACDRVENVYEYLLRLHKSTRQMTERKTKGEKDGTLYFGFPSFVNAQNKSSAANIKSFALQFERDWKC